MKAKNMKIKPILPSMREKKRYLSFKIKTKAKLNSKVVTNTIKKASKSFLGEYGCANAGIIHIENKFNNNQGVIRVNNKFVSHLRASLMFIDKIENEKAIFQCLKTSGIIKKIEV